MPEYGRNVQKMIEYLLTVDDREKRLKNAEAIIELMGTLNPHLKVIEDYKHKLWDHLFQMTDFNLDVDAPYPCPTAEMIFKKPEPIDYPQSPIKHRHLGKNLDAFIDIALAEENDEKRQWLTQSVGYYMKLAYSNWHKEPIHDDMIKSEINEISQGELQYEPGGSRPFYDNTRSFKSRQGGQGGNNRNFKGGHRNNNNNSGGGQGNNSSYNGNAGYSKNRKFNKNKNK